MSSRRFTVVSTIALMVSLVWSASAQAQGRGGFFRRFNTPEAVGLRILGNEKAQAELKLTDKEKPEIKKITDDLDSQRQAMFANFQNLSEDERTKKADEYGAKTKEGYEKAVKLLSAAQTDRLKQLERQVRGAVANLGDDDVALALKLSNDQKSQVKAVEDDMQRQTQELFQAGGDQQERRQKMGEIRTKAEEKALAVLTADQRKSYDALLGAKYEAIDELRFGGGRPRN